MRGFALFDQKLIQKVVEDLSRVEAYLDAAFLRRVYRRYRSKPSQIGVALLCKAAILALWLNRLAETGVHVHNQKEDQKGWRSQRVTAGRR